MLSSLDRLSGPRRGQFGPHCFLSLSVLLVGEARADFRLASVRLFLWFSCLEARAEAGQRAHAASRPILPHGHVTPGFAGAFGFLGPELCG